MHDVFVRNQSLQRYFVLNTRNLWFRLIFLKTSVLA